jgi:hypothetical protein
MSPAPPRNLFPRSSSANRANAAKSTGPTTATGKARSSQNACQHGFSSANFAVVRLEDIEEVARLRADLIAVDEPVNSQEFARPRAQGYLPAGHAARRPLRSRPVLRLPSECLESDGSARFPLHEDVTYGIEVTLAQNRNYMLADGFLRLARQGNGIQLFLRYQAQAERL